MEIFAVVIAALSFFLSALAIYFSYFRKPALSAYVGPYIVTIHNNLGLCLTVPTTIANQSNQVGVVRRCSLTLTKHDSRQNNYYMVWDSFRRITDDGATWVQEGAAHAIPVLGRATKTHNIQYIWQFKSKPDLLISPGSYELRFDFWSEEDSPFTSVKHEMSVSVEDAEAINASLALKDSPQLIRRGVVYLTLDSETNRNRIMTEHEMRRLL